MARKAPIPSRQAPRAKSGEPPAHRGNRFGRSEEARDAILAAADDLLVEVGLAALTIEAIAARAGVGKQTIYRWWASKTDVLLDAFVDDAISEIDPQDSGNLEKDLRRHLTNLSKFLTESDAGAVFKALIGQAQNDPELAQKIHMRFLGSQRQADCLPIGRAIERGDLPRNTDIDAAVDFLVGPIYYRVLVSGDALTPAFVRSLVDHFLAGVRK